MCGEREREREKERPMKHQEVQKHSTMIDESHWVVPKPWGAKALGWLGWQPQEYLERFFCENPQAVRSGPGITAGVVSMEFVSWLVVSNIFWFQTKKHPYLEDHVHNFDSGSWDAVAQPQPVVVQFLLEITMGCSSIMGPHEPHRMWNKGLNVIFFYQWLIFYVWLPEGISPRW